MSAPATLYWVPTGPRTGELRTAAGRVILSGVSLDAAGEEYLGVTITYCG